MSASDPRLYCLVEIPKGSRNKYEWNEQLGAITLDRFLFSSVVYPTDYGFIPETRAEDGDPLDAMVCVSEPTFPGCVIAVKPIALFKMRDDKGVDDKVLCVPLSDPNWNTMDSLEDLPQALRDEISHFFSIYKQPEGKVVKVDGWHDLDTAKRCIEAARGAWREERAAGSEERAAGSEERAAGSEERAAGSGERAAGSGERAAGSEERAATSEERAAT